jgi:hypothetical protein
MKMKIIFQVAVVLATIGLLIAFVCGVFWWSHIHSFKVDVLDNPITVGEQQPLSITIAQSKCRWHNTLNIIVLTDTHMHDVSIEQSTVFLEKNRTMPSHVTLSAQDKNGKVYQAVLNAYTGYKLVFSFGDKIPWHTHITEIKMTSEKDMAIKSIFWLDCTPW